MAPCTISLHGHVRSAAPQRSCGPPQLRTYPKFWQIVWVPDATRMQDAGHPVLGALSCASAVGVGDWGYCDAGGCCSSALLRNPPESSQRQALECEQPHTTLAPDLGLSGRRHRHDPDAHWWRRRFFRHSPALRQLYCSPMPGHEIVVFSQASAENCPSLLRALDLNEPVLPQDVRCLKGGASG